MAATYHAISVEEALEFFESLGFEDCTSEYSGIEMVFKKVSSHNPCIHIKVFTTVSPRTGEARPVDQKTIRIVGIYTPEGRTDGIAIWKERTYRINSWKENVLRHLKSFAVRIGKPCPRCNTPTFFKEGDGYAFYGCLNFKVTGCRGSLSIPKTTVV